MICMLQGLQLLEFLVKNGSERVVDDARSHMSLLRMLRQFHYIDQNGKDQGINVRNRSSELVKLLGDVDLIRAERKKARANRNKFGGFEGGMGIGGGLSNRGSRYGGFGSDSLGYGGYSGGVYGDGGGFGGATNDFQDSGRRGGSQFDEYDEYDEADATPPTRRGPSPPRTRTKQPEPPKPKEPEQDLFDFGDDEPAPTSTAAGKQPAAGSSSGLDILDSKPADDDDDFDDFQSATPAPQPASSSNQFSIPPPSSTVSTNSNTQFVAPKPVSGSQGANLNGLVGFTSMTPTPTSSTVGSPTSPAQGSMMQPQQQQQQQQQKPTGFQAATPNYFTSVSVNTNQPPSGGLGHKQGMSSISSLQSGTTASSAGNKPAAAKSSGDAFGSLWSTASANAGIQKSNSTASKGPNLASMAKEKASAGIWGAPAASSPSPALSQPSQQQQPAQQGSSSKTGSAGLDDLLG